MRNAKNKIAEKMRKNYGKDSPASLSVESKGQRNEIRRSINKNDKDTNK